MSVYVMSDLHGCYNKYMEMLRQIDLKKENELYILGDVVDRGPEPIRLLQEIMHSTNVHLLMGNHEDMFLNSACVLVNDGCALYGDRDTALLWIHCNGGSVTAAQYEDLSHTKRVKIIKYLESLPLYKELEVNGKQYVLFHGGFSSPFNPSKKMSKYKKSEILWERIELKQKYFPDKITVSGHTPTVLYNNMYKNLMIIKKDKILIDCGCFFGNSLGCLRLDDMKSFYVV